MKTTSSPPLDRRDVPPAECAADQVRVHLLQLRRAQHPARGDEVATGLPCGEFSRTRRDARGRLSGAVRVEARLGRGALVAFHARPIQPIRPGARTTCKLRAITPARPAYFPAVNGAS